MGTMVHVRVDEHFEAEAADTLASMGLSLSDAVRALPKRTVADKPLPFKLKAPNPETRRAMAEADEIVRAQGARFGTGSELIDELEKKGRK